MAPSPTGSSHTLLLPTDARGLEQERGGEGMRCGGEEERGKRREEMKEKRGVVGSGQLRQVTELAATVPAANPVVAPDANITC